MIFETGLALAWIYTCWFFIAAVRDGVKEHRAVI